MKDKDQFYQDSIIMESNKSELFKTLVSRCEAWVILLESVALRLIECMEQDKYPKDRQKILKLLYLNQKLEASLTVNIFFNLIITKISS